MDISLRKKDKYKNLEIWYGNQDIGYLIEREMMIEPIMSNFNLKTTNGLDIGCGKRKSLPTAIGIDKGRGFAETKLNLISFAKPDLVWDAKTLPFKDSTIDWITSSHVIEHFEEPVKVLNEWLRVLKIGGIISLIIPIAEYVGTIENTKEDMTHEHDYSVESFKREVIDKLNVEVVNYKDLNNKWSFLCVLKKIK
ncbi:class I SAM-dependent methyltransferase [Candidatus Pacearchaeota archaeon]|nr:class I SAM-dependent methyltransferase [Candidatus Pacearchaeota archaeon]